MQVIHAGRGPRSVIVIRLLVGAVFLAEGIQKFLFPAALGSVGSRRSESRRPTCKRRLSASSKSPVARY
jgi:hypothetical protein